MTFYEEYTRDEKYFGTHTFRFVVSDTFADLFKETWDEGDGLSVDIFQTGDVAKRLENEDNTQGIDELSIDIYQSNCRTDNELNALFFFLEAKDITQNRFCTVLFNPVYVDGVALDSCVWFIGKISGKMQAQDLKWNRTGDYAKVITPERVWKAKSYSLDISLFDKIKLWGKGEDNRITLPGGGTTLPLMHADRIVNETDVAAIFAYRLAYGTDAEDNRRYVHFWPLANIYDILTLLFDKTEDILLELTNSVFTITLSTSNLGWQTGYIKYSNPFYNAYLQSVMIDDSERTLLKISDIESGVDTDTGITYSTIFLHRRLVNPYWHGTYVGKEYETTIAEQEAIDSNESKMSFINYENLTTLLHEIARGLNCYLLYSTTVNGGITIRFVAKNTISESDTVYLKDAFGPSLNISSEIASSKANEYYSQSTLYTMDGDDVIILNLPSVELKLSEKLIANAEARKLKKDIDNIESKRLLFSTAWTQTRKMDSVSKIVNSYPMNTLSTQEIMDDYTLHADALTLGYEELLFTGLYIKTKPKEITQISKIGAEADIWRQANKLFINYDGEDKEFETLSAFINYDAKTSVQYYENSYEMTVPWWSGFSKSEDGSDPSWSNLIIGSKIPLNEVIRIFDGSSWLSYLHDEDTYFTVTDITRSTQKPETKIKLLNIGKFAYGVWSGTVNSLTALSYSYIPFRDINFLIDGIHVKRYYVAAGETIETGEAVVVNSSGEIVKAINHSDYRSKTKGIALETGDGDDADNNYIAVQLSGNVWIEDWDFTGYVGKQVFIRKNLSGTNISTTLLFEPADDEDMIIYLGEIDSINSINLDIHEYKLEETLCQA